MVRLARKDHFAKIKKAHFLVGVFDLTKEASLGTSNAGGMITNPTKQPSTFAATSFYADSKIRGRF
jgi:hypothetical protein